MINKIWNALVKTRERISSLIKGRPGYEEIEELLILSDVGLELSEEIINRAKKERGEPLETVKKILVEILKKERTVDTSLPYTMVVAGVNGSGKTTTVAKLGYKFSKMGKKVLLGAADTYRDAGVLQLEKWANKYGIDIVRAEKGQDPGAVAYDTVQKAKSKGYDTVIIDTAGRLHTRGDLMQQVKKIIHATSKSKQGPVNEVLLVLDATTGQNAIVQAQSFYKDIGVNGIIVTKLDGTARGGFIVKIVKDLGIPVRYVGVGEGIEDIIEFNPEEFVEALFGTQRREDS